LPTDALYLGIDPLRDLDGERKLRYWSRRAEGGFAVTVPALVLAHRALIGQIKSGGALGYPRCFRHDRRSGREAAQDAVPVRQPIKPTLAAIPGA
jgi:hypothetical protein